MHHSRNGTVIHLWFVFYILLGIVLNLIAYWAWWIVNWLQYTAKTCICGWESKKKSKTLNKLRLSQMLFTYTPCWKGQRGQKKRRGYFQRSSSSTAWCPCLHSKGRCSWEGGQLTADRERHPDSTTTPSLTGKASKIERRMWKWRGWMRSVHQGGRQRIMVRAS